MKQKFGNAVKKKFEEIENFFFHTTFLNDVFRVLWTNHKNVFFRFFSAREGQCPSTADMVYNEYTRG